MAKKHELVFNEIDKAVRSELGLAFPDDQEAAIRRAIIAAFIAYENFESPSFVFQDCKELPGDVPTSERRPGP